MTSETITRQQKRAAIRKIVRSAITKAQRRMIFRKPRQVRRDVTHQILVNSFSSK